MFRTTLSYIVAGFALTLPMTQVAAQDGSTENGEAKSSAPQLEGPNAPLSDTAFAMFEDDKVIKTIQRKNFFKAQRFEFTVYGGGVTNDPFLKRWLGGAAATYHVNEIFSLETAFSFSPDLGDSDNRPLTDELQTNYAVAPIISKVRYQSSFDVIMSPFYGKFSFLRSNIVNFDIYLAAGLGTTRTQDQGDYADYKCDGTLKDPSTATADYQPLDGLEVDTLCQWHLTTNYGFGIRGAFNEWMAIRFDGRQYSYIEHTIEEPKEKLGMKSNFVAQVGLSFFFPKRPGALNSASSN